MVWLRVRLCARDLAFASTQPFLSIAAARVACRVFLRSLAVGWVPCADPNDPCTSNASCNKCRSEDVRAVAVDVGLLLSAG